MEHTKLKKNSWHSKIFKRFYDKTDYELPSTLCTYFWATILAIICFIPKEIILLPNTVYNLITKRNYDEKYWSSMGWYLIFYVSFIFISGFLSFITEGFNNDDPFQVVFFGAIGIGLIVLIINAISFIYKRRKKFKYNDPKFKKWYKEYYGSLHYFESGDKSFEYKIFLKETRSDNFFTIFVKTIKGWYNKYCPVIEWN